MQLEYLNSEKKKSCRDSKSNAEVGYAFDFPVI